MEALRRHWVSQLGVLAARHFILDTTPVIAVGYRRDKSRSGFLATAEYGYCAARKLKYFGYKLVLLIDFSGIPICFELVPANTDERAAADEILPQLKPGSGVFSDKGLIGQEWQARWKKYGIQIDTPRRKNQTQQNPEGFDKRLNRVRQRIETIFDCLKEGGRSVEKTLAKTLEGLTTRIIAKITGFTLKHILKKQFGINSLNYSVE